MGIPLALFGTSLRAAIELQLRVQAGRGPRVASLLRFSSDTRFSPEEAESIRTILEVRKQIENDHTLITITDFGAGASQTASRHHGRRVSDIYRTSAVSHHWGVFLFRLVRLLRPRRVLELGTNLGVSACYIQSALDLNADGGRLTSIEGDPTLAAYARRTIGTLSHYAPDVVVGRFHDMLVPTLDRLGAVDLVFVDGHHEEEPTRRYYETIKSYLTSDGVVVFDDIGFWSVSVRRAWKKIIQAEKNGLHLDLGRIGILCASDSRGTV